ncbi:MAG: amino acid adenylation domain-containing protein, partial [Acidobacteria bacterium]|nr:amino acid adenylation domain-containing protein [Acidobacteriota bacterium]
MRDTGTVNEEFEKAKKYWQSKFAGEAHEINLPCDFERSLVYKREEYPMGFPADLSNKLLSLSKNQDLLLYVVLLAALKILIFKYTDEPDISIGAPVYIDTTITEPQPGTKRSGAAGETFIIFREILDNNMTFKELLINVKSTLIDAYENQHYVIENMLDVLGVSIPKKILSRIILVLKHFQRREIIQHVIDSPDNDIAIFISKSENGDVLKGSMEYNHKLFKPDTIEWLVKHYLYVLEQVVNNINIKLSDVDLLLDEERKQVLDDFNDTGTLYPRDKTIQALFTDQVEKAPANNAIVSIDNSLTYGLLQEKAGRLAAVLRLKGVTANTIVGLMIESPIEIAIGIMGVLKAGGAYLPIDLEYPTERKEYMLDDSQIALIVTEQHVLTVEQPLLRRFPGDNIIPVDKVAASGGNNISNRDGQLAHGQGGNPDDPAYVIYTSGTTGRPKGVLIRQRGLVNYTCWRLAAYKYTEKDVTLQMLPYGFDGFGSNFYSSLLSGGVLFIVPDSYKLNFNFINEVINQYKVTNLSVVPAIYQMILDNAEGENLKSLRFIVLAGEKSSGALVRKSKEKVPAALLFNEYGPTEATVTAAGSSFIDEFNTAIIGKPIANVHIYLLDSCLKPVPIRVTGELFIAGTGVSQGYLNNPELTAEKFGPLITLMPQMTQMKNKNSALRADLNAFGDEKNLQHSSFSIQHSILYRTGDLARWLPDGNLEIMGRKDSQVKIRGFRIETKEIESRLHEFPGIKEAIVTYFEDQEGEKHLCAYFVSAAAVNIPGLKENLAAALPDYMLPSHFMQLEKIPLTPNGKIDFKVLPVPQREKGSSYLPPRDLLEEKLVDIWADILGLDKGMVGIEHNFFELGGHSLRATKLISRIAKELNLKIPLGEMFKMPTIRALGAYIKNASEDSDSSIIPMEEKEFYGLSYNQQRLWVTYQREPDNPAFKGAWQST